jgi:hypothetical protein
MTIMLDRLIDRLGEWNPQLFRELKSRFTATTFIAVTIVTILIQIVGIGLFVVGSNNAFKHSISSNFIFLSWIVPLGLILGGVYAIGADFSREEKHGTLNFIKLTPQSARSIFLGKILGVPSLIYLAVGLTVPLHFTAGILAGASLQTIFAWDLTICMTAYLCFSLTILYGLYGAKHPILLTLLLSIPINSFIGFCNFFLSSAITHPGWMDSDRVLFSWFYLPIVNNIFLFYSFIILILSIVSYWLWVTIERKYINLFSTAFTKADSYWMNGQFQIWLLGFAIPILMEINDEQQTYIERFYVLAVFYSIGAVWIFFTMLSILPNRQSMQEWSRDRGTDLGTYEHRHWWQQELVRDLLWHDRSPIIVAMLINLSISAIVWGLCFGVFIHDRDLLIKSICGIIIASILMLIHTVIINFIYLRSRAKRTGAIPLTIPISWIPILLGGLMTISNPNLRSLGTNLLLFSPFAWMAVTQLSLLNIAAIAIGQLGILVGLTKLLQRRLQKLGNSATQTLSHQKSVVARSNI